MNNKIKFLLVAANVEGELVGKPEIIEFDKFQQMQKDVSEQTDGNCSYAVLAEITGDYHVTSKTISDCDNKICTYFNHYLVYFKPTEEFPQQLQHEAYHAAEEKCEVAQKRYIEFLENPERDGQPIPEHLERTAARWERCVCA